MARKKKGPPGVAIITDRQEDAFLRAILEHPDDDTHRLVYADWLMDRDNPRGEFIRAQVLAEQEGTPSDQQQQFTARAKQLLNENGWLPEFFDPGETKIERGFVTRFRLELEDSEESDGLLAPLASDPFFALTAAHVNFDYEENPYFSIIARLPRLGCLGKIDWETLNLGCLYENDSASEESPLGALMLGSPHLIGLRELRLAACGLKDGAVIALAGNPGASTLRVLNLGSDYGKEVAGNYYGDDAVKALAGSIHLRHLEELDLGDAWLSDQSVAYLCASKLVGLRKLNLYGIGLTNAGYQMLAQSPFSSRLAELRIGKAYYQSENLPGEAGVLALARSPHLENIEKLRIDLGGLTEAVMRELRQRFGDRVQVKG